MGLRVAGDASWLTAFLRTAEEQARRRGDRSLAAVHIALALARPASPGHPLLTALGINPLDWRDQILNVLGWREGARAQLEGRPAGNMAESLGDLRYTGPLRRESSVDAVVELAQREAATNETPVGPAHLLVGLLLEADDVGGATGRWLGMTVGRVRAGAGLCNEQTVVAGGAPHAYQPRPATGGPLVLCGGGADSALLAEVLALAGERASTRDPRVVLIDLGWHTRPSARQRSARLDTFRRAGAVGPVDARLTDRDDAASPEVSNTLADADLIWFAGGDAAAIYHRLWATPALAAIRKAHAGGAVVAGQSAGAIVWGAGTVSTFASLGEPEAFPLFGWIDVVVFAHYTPQREQAFRRRLSWFPGYRGIAVAHGGALVVGSTTDQFAVIGRALGGVDSVLLTDHDGPLFPIR